MVLKIFLLLFILSINLKILIFNGLIVYLFYCLIVSFLFLLL